jgi:hypothetical protein
MRYQLGVEEFEPDHWIAWVFEHPGCYSIGQTRTESIGNAGASIAAYHHWVGLNDPAHNLEDPYIDTHVVESFDVKTASDGSRPNALFEDDRQPLKAEDIARTLELLQWTRRDLLAVLDRVPAEKWKDSPTGNSKESVQNIVKHIGAAEWWLMDRLGLGFAKEEVPGDPRERLEKARAQVIKRFPELAGNDQVLKVEGEEWTGRKLARRVVWHERDHTHQIEKLLPPTGGG